MKIRPNQHFKFDFTAEERSSVQTKASEIAAQFKSDFFNIENYKQTFDDEMKELQKKINFEQFDYLLHIGMGGSVLGPQTLIEANGTQTKNTNEKSKRIDFIDNIDPDIISGILNKIQNKIGLDKSLFCFVSKSGNTAETLALLSSILNFFKQHSSGDNFSPESFLKNNCVFITEYNDGAFRQLADQYDVPSLSIPKLIGGRFSVFSAVGLFPAWFAGIEINEYFKGISRTKEQLEQWANLSLGLNECFQKGIDQTVLMPYSSKLSSLSKWFVQLWAESLGKARFDGQPTGLTPIPAVGPSDQHAQMQLFMEGPHDKVVLFVQVKSFEEELSLKELLPHPKLNQLNQFKLNDLLEAELQGSFSALEQREKPACVLTLENCAPAAISELMFGLQFLTAAQSTFLNINPFDQPGVELGKKLSFEFLAANS